MMMMIVYIGRYVASYENVARDIIKNRLHRHMHCIALATVAWLILIQASINTRHLSHGARGWQQQKRRVVVVVNGAARTRSTSWTECLYYFERAHAE